MSINLSPCPTCNNPAAYSPKRGRYYCAECEITFDPPPQKIESQTIFLSYAHKSLKSDDYDISEDLVWLIKKELENDGHVVWIDHEGIRGGTEWRERITDAITSHKHFLAFLSKRSVRHEPNVCLNEVAIAIKHNRIIQTILTETENQVSAPLTLSSIQWHQFQDWQAIQSGQKTGPKGEDWNTWFGNLMSEIRQNLADITHQKAAGELAELKEILKPTSFEAAIINSVEGFFGREWLFNAIHNWLSTDNRLFWLKGSPGIGKSSFAAKLVHLGNSSIVGFFKCDFQGLKSAEESANECIRTLAYQLASRLPDYRIKLLRGQQVDQETVQNKTADDLFTYLITEPLNRSDKIAESQRLALVIDGLDEAGRLVNGKMVNPLADLLYKHVDQLPTWLGIILTSRPEAYLQQQLAAKFSPMIMEGGTKDNIQDIQNYLEMKLDPSITGQQRINAIQTIIHKSGGSFLYVKRVELHYDVNHLDSLPVGLDDLFYKDFERYFPDGKQYEEKTEQFLRLLVASPGPLPKELAQELLEWQARDITLFVTQPMASLLTETKEGLQFFHKSITDWLQDGTRSGIYQVNDNGAKKLGDFLWREFKTSQFNKDKGQDSRWEQFILNWLTELLPKTEIWGSETSLYEYAEYLNYHQKYHFELILQKQLLHLNESQFGQHSQEYARCLFQIGKILDYTGQYQAAIDHLNLSLSITEKIVGRIHLESASIINLLAEIWFTLADYLQAEKLYREALSIREKLLGNRHPDTAQSMAYLAGLLQSTSKYEQAQSLYSAALDVMKEHYGNNHPETMTYTTYLAGIFEEKGDYQESERLFKHILDLNRTLLNDSDPDLSLSIGYVGWTLASKGDFDSAEIFYNEALEIQKIVLGPEHPYTARTLTYLGDIKLSQGNPISADHLYQQSLSIRKSIFGDDHPDTSRTLMSVAWLAELNGQTEIAGQMYQHALNVFINTCGSDYPDTGNARNHLGSWYLRHKEDVSTAKQLLELSLEIHERVLGSNHPYTLRTIAHHAELLLATGNIDGAIKKLQFVVTKRDDILGSKHPDTLMAKASLSWITDQTIKNKNSIAWKNFPNPNSLRLAVR